MGKRRHASSAVSQFIDANTDMSNLVYWHYDGGWPHVKAELDKLEALGPERTAYHNEAPFLMEAAVWLGFMTARRVQRAYRGGMRWWLSQQGPINDWLKKMWPNVYTANDTFAETENFDKIFCIVHTGWQAECEKAPPREIVKALRRVAKFGEAADAALERGLTAKSALIMRGSNSTVVKERRAFAERFDAIVMKHSVQKRMLCESTKFATAIKSKRPKRVVFPSAGRVGREAFRGDVEVAATVGVAITVGSGEGAVGHRTGGGATDVRKLGRLLDGWYLVHDDFTSVQLEDDNRVPGTRAALVSPRDAKRAGLIPSFEVRAGADRTLLHLVVILARLAPFAVIKLVDCGDDVATIVGPKRSAQIADDVLARLPGRDYVAARKFSEALERARYTPRGSVAQYIAEYNASITDDSYGA